jgi:hypothetical protein
MVHWSIDWFVDWLIYRLVISMVDFLLVSWLNVCLDE